MKSRDSREIYIGFEDTQLLFRTDVEEVASSIVASHSSMIVPAGDEIVGSLEVYRTTGGYVCLGHNELEYQGDPSNLTDWLNREILEQFIRAHPSCLWLHAGAVQIAGRAVLIVGPSGQGKSTLVTHLLDSGWAYLSDEMAPIRNDSWDVLPYPRTPVRRVNPGRHVESIVRDPIKREANSMTLRPSLPSLRRGLLTHRLADDVLIYDTALENIHLLDVTTARVAELLDQGRDEIDIVAELEGQPGSGAGDPLLALALDELSKADLIEYSQPALPMTDVTRRQLLQKLAAVGAGLVIPMVLSVTPGRAGAQSAGCGQGCGSNSVNCQPFAGCPCCAKPISGFPDHTCQAIPFTTANCHGSP